MSKIFDNIETKFEEGLHAILTNVGVERADFCVGYFNLRGWQQQEKCRLWRNLE